jgi:cyanophycinase-like exopeptidase
MMGNNIPIGGTSAGLMVLGQIDFSAANGTIYSAEAMSNPYSRRMTLDTGFLTADHLQGTITDAHLDTRDRMGRLMAFMARTIKNGWIGASDMRGIGVDVETAVLVEDGKATLAGVGAAYFLKSSIAPTVCEPKTPLTFRSVAVDKLMQGGSFDLQRWGGAGLSAHYNLSVETGVLTSDQPGGSPY